jgi:hypothetical protein
MAMPMNKHLQQLQTYDLDHLGRSRLNTTLHKVIARSRLPTPDL